MKRNSSYIAYWDEGVNIDLQQLGYRVKATETMSIIDWEGPHNEAGKVAILVRSMISMEDVG